MTGIHENNFCNDESSYYSYVVHHFILCLYSENLKYLYIQYNNWRREGRGICSLKRSYVWSKQVLVYLIYAISEGIKLWFKPHYQFELRKINHMTESETSNYFHFRVSLASCGRMCIDH